MSEDSAPLIQESENHDALVKQENVGETLKNSEDKADTTINVTDQTAGNTKDDCSDLTDNNNDNNEEQIPKTFPQKLMEVLLSSEHTHIISFLDHGNGFVIHKKKAFANEVLPKSFKASKFTSFTRKLNRWGFQRVPRGPETGAYYHKMFRRDKPDLLLQMASNSEKKLHHSPLQQLLPNMQGLAAPGMGMFPYMPPQATMMPAVAPQQQALWQQQYQMMQFQQLMQMQQQQAMQAAAAAAAATASQANSGAPMQSLPMNQHPMMMMMMQASPQALQMTPLTLSSPVTMGGILGGGVDLGQQQNGANLQTVSQEINSDLSLGGGGLIVPDALENADV